MAITNAICKSFIDELTDGTHDFSADTFKIALYTDDATLNADTTAYSATNEVSHANYTAGGETITVTLSRDGNTKIFDFSDPSWTSVTFNAAGALIYNSSKANRAFAVLDFGAVYAVNNGNFSITMPPATATQAIIRCVNDG